MLTPEGHRQAAAAQPREATGDHRAARGVEPHAIDERTVRRGPVEPWLRIPGLGTRRHRSDFHEAEPEAGEAPHRDCILVEPGSQSDPVREGETHRPHRGIARSSASQQAPGLHRPQREPVRGFRRQGEEQAAQDAVHGASLSPSQPGDRYGYNPGTLPSRCADRTWKPSTDLLQERVHAAMAWLESRVVGQQPLIRRLVMALLCDGHLLVEGAPGLAKTRAIKELARTVEGSFHRIQFTPDLLPSDVTGTEVVNTEDGTFTFRKGPVFHNLLLADEVNRAPAKVQAALLEAMAERQVSYGRETFALPDLFLVMATQNPIEHEGTYPLPEAQLDRFLLHVTVVIRTRRRNAKSCTSPAASSSNGGCRPRRRRCPSRTWRQPGARLPTCSWLRRWRRTSSRSSTRPDAMRASTTAPARAAPSRSTVAPVPRHGSTAAISRPRRTWRRSLPTSCGIA